MMNLSQQAARDSFYENANRIVLGRLARLLDRLTDDALDLAGRFLARSSFVRKGHQTLPQGHEKLDTWRLWISQFV